MSTSLSDAEACLALNKGPKTRTTPLPNRYLFGLEEKEAVCQLFDDAIAGGSHFLGYNGAQEAAYCEEFAAWMGGGYADGVNSGTNAVYIALRALELEPYSEVIVPPVSDPGGVMPVALCNLIPIPADSAPGSFNPGAAEIAARITPRTRAIMVAHISGIPADMDAILALAKEHKLKVIEDCAQCHGGTYKGKKLGTLGDIASFSTMFGKHHSTGGQGGVVFTKDEALYWKIRQHADRGKPFGVTIGNKAGSGVGVAAAAGGNILAALNCNMDELHACIGRIQLRRLPGFLQARRQLAQYIEAGCKNLAGFRLVGDPPYGENAYWFLFFHFDAAAYRVDKSAFQAAMEAEGVPLAASYLIIPPRQPWATQRYVFGDGSLGLPWSSANASSEPPPLPNIEATDASHLRLLIHEGWTTTDADDLLAALKKVDAAYRLQAPTL